MKGDTQHKIRQSEWDHVLLSIHSGACTVIMYMRFSVVSPFSITVLVYYCLKCLMGLMDTIYRWTAGSLVVVVRYIFLRAVSDKTGLRLYSNFIAPIFYYTPEYGSACRICLV